MITHARRGTGEQESGENRKKNCEDTGKKMRVSTEGAAAQM